MTNDVSRGSAGAGIAETFLANRSHGRIALVARLMKNETRRGRVSEEGCLRVRFPAAVEGSTLEAVIVNTAGGIAGGDRHELDILVAEKSELVVTTAAAEKVYRSMGAEARIDVTLKVGAGARLGWLPQETILFDEGYLSRHFDVALAADASLTMAEMTVFGRAAMGERVAHGSFVDRWRIQRGGKLLFADTLRLDGAIAQKLAEPGVAAGGIAVATALIVPGDEAMLARVRALRFASEVGISAWNGIAVARLCGKDSAQVREDLIAVLMALETPLPRLWLN